jgi:hypothetical protein
MWGMALCLLSSFFVFREANYLWARLDGPAQLRTYETQAVWFFFPAFAAMSVPWPLTIWMLRRLGRNDEADAICDESNRKSGFNSYRVMVWFSCWVVVPIGVVTLMAIPIHLSIGDSEVRVGRYAKWSSERFRYDQAVRARLVSVAETRGGQRVMTRNLLIDFSDGRTLDSSVGRDGRETVVCCRKRYPALCEKAAKDGPPVLG